MDEFEWLRVINENITVAVEPSTDRIPQLLTTRHNKRFASHQTRSAGESNCLQIQTQDCLADSYASICTSCESNFGKFAVSWCATNIWSDTTILYPGFG